MYMGARQIVAGTITLGDFLHLHHVPGVPGRAGVSDRGIGTQITEAIAGLERTREVLDERPEDEDPRPRGARCRASTGEVVFENVSFAYDDGKEVLHDINFRRRAGNGDGAGGPVGLGQVHDHRPDCGVPRAASGTRAGGRRRSCRRCGWIRTARNSAWCCRKRSCSTARSARMWRSRGRTRREEEILAACRIARVDEFAETIREEVRHDRGRARREAFRRAEAARVDRARDSGGSAHSDSGRGDLEPGFGIGSADSGRAVVPDARPHDIVIAHRLSTIRRADQILVVEAGGSWSAARMNRCMRRAADTTTCTPSSTAWRRICFWRRGKDRWSSKTRRIQELRGRSNGDAALPDAIRLIRDGNSA